ncbi:histone-lysine N-methyltransferase, H3 lysine-9 specific SUVH4-like isoform X2 [Mangifera indica]|uniref:histone-lysine N-methyltransferase, H3 lysine-9 specific SUVH4-like isoform X2 n=1 Tax=Mangifera indica TaxID=29780 RepID=UPI001CFA475C|nr:histone-lysine N-methyltransferase, H3 lysine-9 specific SUVH4-like isoform X2 [Mangifera indica]
MVVQSLQSGQAERRVSARIQEKQREEKLRLGKRRVELPDDAERGSDAKKKQHNVSRRKERKEEDSVNLEDERKVPVQTTKSESESVNGNAVNLAEKSDHAKVKETLRLFNKHYLHFVQVEEARCRKEEVDKKASKKLKSKKGNVPEESTKNKAKRPDLKAVSKMMEENEILYPEKRIGDIPGINVGHQFYSRSEMVAVGFHSHWLNGIDFMGMSYGRVYKQYQFPLAVAIVLSGMYEDDLDNAEDVIYTGQGGHDLTGNKHQVQDQVLERGNLALKVEQYWAEKGISGFTVFKYRLRRLEGQPILTTNQVHFAHGRVPQSMSEIRGLVCEDITGGQENFPIPATNLVDDPPIAPTGFTYCKTLQVAKNVKLPANVTGCNCKGRCENSRTCSCAKLNGSDFPYVRRDGGRLIVAKDVVFECGPNCGCGPDCINRTSQKGLMYRLEVFRTPKKGWAVRSWDFIPSGAPICEYTGVLMRTEDVDNESASDNNYIFDIDCLQTIRGLGGRERRLGDVSIPTVHNSDRPDDQSTESVPEFCIDAGSTGNIARFINHSCEPNLFVQCVLHSHQDIKLARIVLFAADNIPPLQELTYDYAYALDSVHGPDGKVKKMLCYCGAADCRSRLF